MKLPLSKITLPASDLRASIDQELIDELADSLRDHGQLQPIGVRPTENGHYEVVYGARRTRAAHRLGWTEIDAVITETHDDQTTAARKLIENVQRADLTPVEEAYGLQQLIADAEIDIRQLQRQTGKGREWIRSRLDILQMPEDIQAAVQAGALGLAVARTLGRIERDDVRAYYLTAAINNGCTVATAEQWFAMSQYALDVDPDLTPEAIAATADGIPDRTIIPRYTCLRCKATHQANDTTTVIICRGCFQDLSQTRDNTH